MSALEITADIFKFSNTVRLRKILFYKKLPYFSFREVPYPVRSSDEYKYYLEDDKFYAITSILIYIPQAETHDYPGELADSLRMYVDNNFALEKLSYTFLSSFELEVVLKIK
jgi:hypothetical protein